MASGQADEALLTIFAANYGNYLSNTPAQEGEKQEDAWETEQCGQQYEVDQSVNAQYLREIGQSADTGDLRDQSINEEDMSEDEDYDAWFASLYCVHCGWSLLPEDPDGQPLTFCANDRCGMPSGMDFADWKSIRNGAEATG
ncbi:hypothetical protein DL762_003914 [Monosporascus cannonballus]|uniref:Uncharacterized protein n=1 Tax=Monosporascus cannonballus TaxID=155416 RepID=A0ABY0HDA9_9PEZI|nr:hypothetical protein DL762_003914 [Monosporascus cannonballus]RYO94851.1 hypothetical protein DL763_003955 [Monosporascus cannonballus]